MTSIALEKRSSKLQQLISFVKDPQQKVSSKFETKDKIKEVMGFYLLDLLISVILMFFITTFLKLVNEGPNLLVDSYSPLMVLLIGGILAPLAEEAIFRLSIFFNPVYLSISAGLFVLMKYSSSVHDVGLLNTEVALLERCLITLLTGIAIYAIAKKFHLRLQRFWNSRFRWIYYSSAVFFGILHIGNYDLGADNFYWAPIVILPFVVSGLILGYVRIKHGFKYGLFLHMFNNLIAFSIALLFPISN